MPKIDAKYDNLLKEMMAADDDFDELLGEIEKPCYQGEKKVDKLAEDSIQ